MKITTKCPKCRKSLRFEMYHAATDIQYHTCVNTDIRWVIHINPAKSVNLKGNQAYVSVIDWQEVV